MKIRLWALIAALLLGLLAPAGARPAAAACASPYVVARGDSLGRIARICGTTIAALKAANNLTADIIHPGWQLIIPGGSAAAVPGLPAATGACASPYIVRRGDSLARIARLCGTSVAALKAANGLTRDIIFPDQRIVLPGVPAGQAAPGTPKVVIAVVDGWRYEDTYGDPTHANIPNVWSNLQPLGTWHSQFYNLGQTLTAPGHAAILGGVWQPIPNDGTGRPTAPTLFEYFRAATRAPASETALVFNGSPDGKAGLWAYSTAPGYGPSFAAQIYHSSGDGFDDAVVLDTAVSALAQRPRLMLVAFPAVDEWAHTGDQAGYLRAIQAVDRALWQLWQALQADPYYAGQTTLFITNDHGRRLDDFTNHGGSSESEQHVTLLTVGPRTPAGVEISTRRTLRDIAPTVGALLGFPTPLAEGVVLWEVVR
jgi:LysM repeat protein